MSINTLDNFAGSGNLAAHTPDQGGPFTQIAGTFTLDTGGDVFASADGAAGYYAGVGAANDPLTFTAVFRGDNSTYLAAGLRCDTNAYGYYVVLFSNFTLAVFKNTSAGLANVGFNGSSVPTLAAGYYDFRLTPSGASGGATTFLLEYRTTGSSTWLSYGTTNPDTTPSITGTHLGMISSGTASGSAGLLFHQVQYGSGVPAVAPGTVSLNYFDTAHINLSMTAASGGTGTITYQWYRSSINHDAPGSGTCTLLAGKTALTLDDQPGSATSGRGLYFYFCVATDSNAQTARSQDFACPLGDHARVLAVMYGTSLVQNPATGDTSAAPYIAAEALAVTNGVRHVTMLNCGQGASYSAQWTPTAGAGPNLGTGQRYYDWMTGIVDAAVASTGKSLDWIVVMHETNDVNNGYTPSQYQANMQTTISALHTKYPTAKFLVCYAPFDHLANFVGTTGGTNDGLLAMQVATDALVAANPGLVYGMDETVWRYTGAHPEYRDTTTTPQPDNQVHYSAAGRVGYGIPVGRRWADLIDGTSGSTSGPVAVGL